MEVACAVMAVALIWLSPFGLSLVVWATSARRMRRLEAEVRSLRASGFVASPAGVASPAVDESPAVVEAPAVVEVLPEPEPEVPPDDEVQPMEMPAFQWPSPERVVVWVAAILGGLAAVVATLLALVAAIERGWVGPVARTSSGMVVGVSLWIAGAWLRRLGNRWVSSALSGAGVGTLYGALFAAGGLYHLIPSTLAGAGMVAVTAVATMRAVVNRDRFVAWLALIGGTLTPFLVSSGEDKPYQLFAYLAVLGLGVIVAALRRAWPELVGAAAVALGIVFLTWWAQGYATDRVLPALAGVAMLSAPFALAAAHRDRWVHLAGAVGGVGLSLLAIPWVVPVAAQFYDPYTGWATSGNGGETLWASALAVCWLPIPLVLAGRWRGHLISGTAGAIVASALLVAVGSGWASSDLVIPWVLAMAVGGPSLAVALVAAGSATTPRALLVVPVASGLAIAAVASLLPGPNLALALGLLAGGAVVLGASCGWGPAAGAALLGIAIALAGVSAPDVGWRWLAGLACAGLALTSQVPILARWRVGERWAWGAAALAGLALFAPLHASWVDGLGDSLIGLLPLLLAINALVAILVLVRRGALQRDETVTAVFAGAVLLGIVAAVPLQLEQRWLTVAWALQAAALAAISHRVRHPMLRWAAVGVAVVVGVRLVFNPAALAWGSAADGWPVLNWTLYSWGIPLICLLLVAKWIPRPEIPEDVFRFWVAPLAFLAALVGFALVNVEVSHAFQDAGPLELGGAGRMQGMVRSASWAAYGLGILGLGLWRDVRWVRLVGFAFVMLATVKVFGFDLWGLQGFVRVGSVGCLAVSLLMAALVFERLVLRSRGPAPIEEE